MRSIYAVLLGAFVVFSPVVQAASSKNCRLVIQVYFKDGRKRVKVEETGALSRIECKYEAEQRQLDSEAEDVKRVNVVFGYRGPSVLDSE